MKTSTIQNPLRNLLNGIAPVLFAFILLAVFSNGSSAQITITPANITVSTDKAANAAVPAYSALGQIKICETNATDFAASQANKTIILTAPSNWSFKLGFGGISRTSHGSFTGNTLISVSTTTITITFSTSADVTNIDTLIINSIFVMAADGNLVPGSGNITRTGGDGNINGWTAPSAVNCGTLAQTAGALHHFVVNYNNANIGTKTIFTQFPVTFTAKDQFNNTITTYNTSANLTASNGGPAIIRPLTTGIGWSGGSKTMNVTLYTTGSYTITATNASKTGTSNSFNVNSTGTINSCFASTTAAENAAKATLIDNCGPLSKSSSTSGTCTATVSVVVSDTCGQSGTVTFATRIDNSAPTFTSNSIASHYATQGAAESAALAAAAAAVSDNCTSVPTLSLQTTGTCNITIQVTATDECNNQSTAYQYNTTIDGTAPVISGCPSNITLNSNNNNPAICNQIGTWVEPTANDDCVGFMNYTTRNIAPGSSFSSGSTTVTYTFTDNASNTSTCSFTVTVADNTAPVVSGCPNNISVSTGTNNLNCSQTATWTEPTANDNCQGAMSYTSRSNAPGSSFSSGTTTVTYTFTDGASNSSTCTFTVTVADNTVPVVSGCPSNISVYSNDGNTSNCSQAATWAPPTALDNCSGSVTPSHSHSPADVFSLGTTTVTYTFTDGSSNSSTCSFTVTVLDNTAPAISGCPANLTVYSNSGNPSNCSQAASWTPPTALDNCSGSITPSNSHSPGDVFSSGTTTVTYTFTDGASNSSTCTFTVTVADNTAPVVSGCPSNITVHSNDGNPLNCSQAASWTPPTALDNCSGSVTPSHSHSPADVFSSGTTTVTYTFTDGSSNSSTCSFTVTVLDNTAPVVSNCPANITVHSNDGNPLNCSQTATWTPPTALDNCSGSVTPSNSHNPGSTFSNGTTTVTYTFTDGSSNSSTCSFTVTISDNTAPVISGCPSNVTVYSNAGNPLNCSQPASWTPPTALDNCSGSVTPNHSHSPADVFSFGTTTVTYTFTDGSSNSSTCSFTVTILDNTAPVVSGCPSNISVNTGANNPNCSHSATWTPPTALDNCAGNVTPSSNYNTGDVFLLGTTTVTYTFADASSNSASCSFTVTVSDNTPPVISCPSNLSVYSSQGNFLICDQVATWASPLTSDNCSGSITTNQIGGLGSGISYPLGATTNTFRAEDAHGNTSTCSFTVTVVDDTPPTIVTIANSLNRTISCSNSSDISAAIALSPSAADNCTANPILHLVSDNTSTTCENSYVRTRVWDFNDGNGNTSLATFTQIITVIDTTKPTFTRPADVTLYKDANCSVNDSPTGTAGDVTNEADNCSTGLNATYSDVVVNHCEGTYTITRTWSLIDNCGNHAADQVQTITVNDNTAPTFTRPANITIYTTSVCGYDASVGVTGDVTNEADNCSTGLQATYTDVTVDGSCEGTHVITRTWSLVDNCGNHAADQVQTITVNDNTAPTFTRPSDITIYTNSGCGYDASVGVAGDVTNEADNCSTGLQATYTDVVNAGSCSGSHIITRTWSLVDHCGNHAADQIQTITVSDNTAPVITCPSNVTVNNDAGNCSAVVNFNVTATDNCSTPSIVSNPASGSVFSVGTTTVHSTATDACGNTSACSFTVTVNTATVSLSSPTVNGGNNISCFGGSDGAINVSLVNGTGPYTYSWTGPNSFTSTASSLTGLSVGSYYVTVYNGCTRTASINVSQPSPINFGGVKVNESCFGGNTGSLTINATGGVGPYTYSTNNGFSYQSNNVFSSLTAGTYSTKVMDANGCLNNTSTFIVTQPQQITTNITKVNINCYGASTGSITIGAGGGTGTKTYSIDNGSNYQAGVAFASLSAATYQVVVKDANNCLSPTTNVVLTQNNQITFTTTVTAPSPCTTASGKIVVVASGGNNFYNYSKNSGGTWQSLNQFLALNTGTYSVKVKDALGCLSIVTPVAVNCAVRDAQIDQPADEYLKAFPNPADEHVTVQFSSSSETHYSLRLTDITGRIVMSQAGTSSVGDNQVELNLDSYAKGVYIILLESGDTTKKLKLILQ